MRICQDLTVCETPAELWQVLRPCPPVVSAGRNGKGVYIDCTCTLDTETTNTQDYGFVWSYQLNIAGQNIVVRTYPQFLEILTGLKTRWGISSGKRLKIHIHNLGYESWYLLQLLDRDIGIKSALFTSSHKVLSVKLEGGVELYDSLKLFQKSLAGATRGCTHPKAVGDLDYKKYHDALTPLTDEEYQYIVYDVQGLWEAIERLKLEGHYNSATLPITNTSRVLNAVSTKVKKVRGWRKLMQKLALPTSDALRLAYNCMAGGDTHGNRYKVNQTWTSCNSYDFKSAHPSQMLTKKYPMGAPIDMGSLDEDDLQTLIDNDYGWIAKVAIDAPRCLPDNPDPTISVSKCPYIEGERCVDNGRLLQSDAIVVYMDSNDYQRFVEGYTYAGLMAVECWAFRLDLLPPAFQGVIKNYFEQKEALPKDTPDYNFAKICVNTIFGACAQKTIRDEYNYSLDGGIEVKGTTWQSKIGDLTDQQVVASQSKIGKLPFLWGLWTASCTRLELWKLIRAVGWDKAIYWDTDSCKYHGDRSADVDAYNARQIELVKSRDAVVINRKGQSVYIGVAEDEHPAAAYGYQEFRALHAKCYASRDAEGVLSVTIAGVRKAEGAAALHDNINLLADGLYINPAGGQKLWYHTGTIGGTVDTPITSWIYMEDRDYQVSFAGDPFAMEVFEGDVIAE